ncbi:MAG: type 4a pilus biogenesis protein PilO [Patescibacteria group bacterium]|jgi:Tfp pilus assembly protein PilO
MKITPKIKLLIIASLGVTSIILIIVFVILPQQRSIINTGKDIYDQRVNYEFISQQRLDLVHLERQIKEIGSNYTRVSSALFSQADTLELITVLENTAKVYGIDNQDLVLSNPVAQSTGLFLSTINISFTSTYQNIINWAFAIEQQPFYLIIDSMTLSNASSIRDSEGMINVQITAKVYWQ